MSVMLLALNISSKPQKRDAVSERRAVCAKVQRVAMRQSVLLLMACNVAGTNVVGEICDVSGLSNKCN